MTMSDNNNENEMMNNGQWIMKEKWLMKKKVIMSEKPMIIFMTSNEMSY